MHAQIKELGGGKSTTSMFCFMPLKRRLGRGEGGGLYCQVIIMPYFSLHSDVGASSLSLSLPLILFLFWVKIGQKMGGQKNPAPQLSSQDKDIAGSKILALIEPNPSLPSPSLLSFPLIQELKERKRKRVTVDIACV